MSSYDIAKTAYGVAKPLDEDEIIRENKAALLSADNLDILAADFGDLLIFNSIIQTYAYTNPDLHRRIDQAIIPEPGSHYLFVKYRPDGTAYPQHVTIGVWDRLHSYRTTTTFMHDEESETCEIP